MYNMIYIYIYKNIFKIILYSIEYENNYPGEVPHHCEGGGGAHLRMVKETPLESAKMLAKPMEKQGF